jgi:hypothetical protein
MDIKKLLILFFALSPGLSFAQTNTDFSMLFDRLKVFDKSYVQEKAYLHFDKPFYALGDTIWFKGYVVNAIGNIPSMRSHILYVDIIDNKGTIWQTLKLPVNTGFAAGDISLSDSLKAGVYCIRAYTNWMRNFDAAYFFNKNITIVDPFSKTTSTQKTATNISSVATNAQINKTPQYDMQFFPEGGQLVNGLKSSVAFKAVSASGKGINITGKLMDESHKVVLNFKTGHAGMGSFIFTPVTGKVYTASVDFPGAPEKQIELPKALGKGYVLTVDNSSSPDSLYITLLCSPELVNKEEMVLMPLSNGVPLFFFKTTFPNSRVNITAPKNKLPGGILQWTLFSQMNEPVAERLVFNDYHSKIEVTLPTTISTYHKREKSTLELQAIDAAGNPVIGSFSIAVTNADSLMVNKQEETTIFSSLLLSSDLKGYIENPNYYFTIPTPQKAKELDNLLLTQGWRRFAWRDIAAGNFPKVNYPVEQDFTISGSVFNQKKNAVANVPVNLLPEGLGAGGIQSMLTDQNGHFLFKIADSLALDSFVLQAKQKPGERLNIKLDKYTSPRVEKQAQELDTEQTAKSATNVNTYLKAEANELRASGKGSIRNEPIRLKEVKIKDYNPVKKLVNSTSANLNGPGHADVVLTGKDVEKFTDLSSLSAFLPGVRIRNGGSHISMSLTSTVGTHTDGVLILVDGQAGNTLDNISPRDVESIEFMKSPVYAGIYGIRGAGGVLLITTKKGSGTKDHDTSIVRHILPLKLTVNIARKFYSPKYNKPESTEKSIDMRTTVYWNPEVVTDENGKATVQYYNTDVPGNYQVVIEGTSVNGHLCRRVFNYTVE